MHAGAPPPPAASAWSPLVAPAGAPPPPAPTAADAAAPDLDAVSSAWKHVRGVSREEGRTPDLYDLLSHSQRDSQYSFQPPGVSPRPLPRPSAARTRPCAA
jgi:hypothetical protein